MIKNNLELALSSERVLDFADGLFEQSEPAELITQYIESYVSRYEELKNLNEEESLRVKEYQKELSRRRY